MHRSFIHSIGRFLLISAIINISLTVFCSIASNNVVVLATINDLNQKKKEQTKKRTKNDYWEPVALRLVQTCNAMPRKRALILALPPYISPNS